MILEACPALRRFEPRKYAPDVGTRTQDQLGVDGVALGEKPLRVIVGYGEVRQRRFESEEIPDFSFACSTSRTGIRPRRMCAHAPRADRVPL